MGGKEIANCNFSQELILVGNDPNGRSLALLVPHLLLASILRDKSQLISSNHCRGPSTSTDSTSTSDSKLLQQSLLGYGPTATRSPAMLVLRTIHQHHQNHFSLHRNRGEEYMALIFWGARGLYLNPNPGL